jgi:hypothetical protein
MSNAYSHLSVEKLKEQIEGIRTALDNAKQADSSAQLSNQLIELRKALSEKSPT